MIFWTTLWAWTNFTWHASAYESDDTFYRVAVFIQIVGALIMAAGIEKAFKDLDFTYVFSGFVIMRLSLVALWLRASYSDKEGRPAALRYAVGITFCQFGWAIVVLILPPSWLIGGFLLMVALEHATPVIAENAINTQWHRGHIIERYGLLTIIVLGEAVLASYAGIQAIIEHPEPLLISSVIGGLIILFSMWWLYFDEDEHVILDSLRGAFSWAYGHFIIFAAVAATGAGLSVLSDQITGHAKISLLVANSTVIIPVILYLLSLAVLHEMPKSEKKKLWIFLAIILAMAISLISEFSILISGFLMMTIIALNKVLSR